MNNAEIRWWQGWQTSLTDPVSVPYQTVLIITLVTGLLLRLAAVYFVQGYHHFMANDEVSALEFVLAFLGGEERAYYLAQPAFNSGNLPGPLWTLLGVTLFKLGGNSAEGALYWMAAVNSITVYFVYLLAMRFMQSGLALVTTVFYALAPWTVYYSYGLYNPVPLDLIGVLLCLALWSTISHAESKHVFWVPLLCAVIPQFHMIGVFVIPAVLLVLFLSPVQLNRRWFIAGIMAGILLYLPYLIGDMLNDWQNLKAMTSGGQERKYSASVLKVITAPATVLSSIPAGWTGDEIEPIKQFGNRWFGHYVVLLAVCGWTVIHSFIFLFSFIHRFTGSARRHWCTPAGLLITDNKTIFIGILVIVPLLLFLLTGHNFSTRYAIILFPLLFMLPGLFLQERVRTGTTKYWIYSLIFTGVFNIYLLGSYYAYQNQRLAGQQQFMPSFRKLETIYQAVKNDAGATHQIEIVLSDTVRELPHFEQKLIYTIKHYITSFERYYYGANDPQTTNRYQVILLGEQVGGVPVFADKSIVIMRVES